MVCGSSLFADRFKGNIYNNKEGVVPGGYKLG